MTMKHFILAGWLAAALLPPALPAAAREQTQEQPPALTLQQVIDMALQNAPLLNASSERAEAAAASRAQAGALPNPELSIDAENIYGDGPYDGMASAEITYGISQLVEMPGKRGNRVRLAEAEHDKLYHARDTAQLVLIRDVTIMFAELAAARQEVAILEEEQALATEVRNSVAARVDAGKEPPIQKNKAEIERSASQMALERARRNLTAKKHLLSSLIGEDTADLSIAVNSLPALSAPDPLESYRARLSQTPDAESLEADTQQAKAALLLEKANAVPDPTFSLGVKDMRDDDAQAFVAGVSFPLPVFNMNRAGIARAGHGLNAALLDQRGAQLSLDADLTDIYGDFSSAYSEASALKTTILPGAEEAFLFAREGYDAGKFSYLDVLDAQRTLFDARRQLNEAVLDYHRQRAAIERMTAVHAAQQTDKDNLHDTLKN